MDSAYLDIVPNIAKYSSASFEEKLYKILAARMGEKEAAAYRSRYKDSFNSSVVPDESLANYTVTINPTHQCNLKCIMCDVPENNRPIQELDFESLSTFLHDMKDEGIKCCMIGSGAEITLYKDWKRLVQLSADLFPDSIMLTNASTLSDSDLKFIVDSKLTRLFISLDAANATTYEKIRGYDLLDKIEQKIKKITKYKNELSLMAPLVRVSFVSQDENKSEESYFIEKWINVVDSVEIQNCWDISQFRDSDYVDSLSTNPPSFTPKNIKCHYPFSYISVWAGGQISACCTSYGRDSSELSYVNLSQPNYLDTLKLQKRKLQEAFFSDDFDALPNSCKHCLCGQE